MIGKWSKKLPRRWNKDFKKLKVETRRKKKRDAKDRDICEILIHKKGVQIIGGELIFDKIVA